MICEILLALAPNHFRHGLLTLSILALPASAATTSSAPPRTADGARLVAEVVDPDVDPGEAGLAAWLVRFDGDAMPTDYRRAPRDHRLAAETDLVIDLGGGFVLPAFIDRVTPIADPAGDGSVAEAFAWSGRILDDSQSTFFLARVGDAFAGAVWHSKLGAFEIQPTPLRDVAGHALTRVIALDPEAPFTCGAGGALSMEDAMALAAPAGGAPQVSGRPRSFALTGGTGPRGTDPAPAPDRRIDADSIVAPHRNTGTPSAMPAVARTPSPLCGCPDDGSRVDILVVYTPQARAQAGGSEQIIAVAVAGVESFNTVRVNSAVDTFELSLAAAAMTNYNETLPPVSYPELLALRRDGDGVMDDVHVLRAQHRADLVAMLRSSAPGEALGIGLGGPGAADMGYSITKWHVAIGSNLVFAHEIGHNFGLMHERENDQGTPLNHHAYGHHFVADDGVRRTVMAYPPGTLVPHFSNPDVEYLGVPTGAPFGSGAPSNNALMLELTHSAVANQFDSGEGFADCNGNGIDDLEEITGNPALDANDNGVLDECEERVYVNADAAPGGDGSSWATALTDLSAVIGNPRYHCSPPLEVRVAAGTYATTRLDPDSSRRDTFVLGAKMTLLGGFASHETAADQRDPPANPTILTGDRLGDDLPGFGNRADNSFRVIRVVPNSNHPGLIDGFTIRGGHADHVVAGFHVASIGGGLYAYGGGVRLHNCIFTDNAARIGGAMAGWLTSEPIELVNTLLAGNRAFGAAPVSFGGGIALVFESSVSLLNCTLSDNEVLGEGGAGGAIANLSSSATIRNSILWGNQAAIGPELAMTSDGIPAAPLPSMSVDHSLVAGGADAVGLLPGDSVLMWLAGNLDGDPLFADPSSGSYRLIAGSPAIDAGDDSALPAWLVSDLDGNARIVDGDDDGIATVDMGAHEHQGPQCAFADLNCDGVVDGADLGLLLGSWGRCAECPADLNGDGVVDGADLGLLLGAWG